MIDKVLFVFFAVMDLLRRVAPLFIKLGKEIEMGLILLIVVMVFAFGIGAFIGDWNRSKEVNDLQARMDETYKHWDAQVGCTTLLNGEMVNYNLRTFDGGKHWYQVEYDKNWGMQIVGAAEEIYPGLLNHLQGIRKLMEHGSITLTSTDSPEADILRNAGFDVVSTTKSN